MVESIFNYYRDTLKLINGIEGTAVECGFGAGISADIIVTAINEDEFDTRSIWLFDSFEGFPEPSYFDNSPNRPIKGQWKRPIEPAQLLQAESKAPVHIVKGFFEDVLPSHYTGGDIAYLHLDCDLYNSYKVTLETLFDKVVKGGLVLFDEYKGPVDIINWPGASKAIDEFFDSRGIQKNFIEVKKREDKNWRGYYHIKK